MAVSGGLILAALLGYVLLGHRVVDALYHRRFPIPAINRIITNEKYSPVDYYYEKADKLLVRLLALCLAGQALGLLSLQRAPVSSFFRRFFNEPASPLNLAIFRIVLFAMVISRVDVEFIAWFNGLPPELRQPPRGLAAIVPLLPVGDELARLACYLLIAAAIAGMVGFCSRSAALIVAVVGTYVLGIPNFYGKVGHYHHMIWFAAILAVSPCGDALSVDAALDAWSRRRRGLRHAHHPPSRLYGVPLRWVWLLMGVIYFFPGLWKIWETGRDWAAGDSFLYILHAKWFELGGWSPPLRIDHYPLVCRVLAVGAIAFELSFIVLVLFRRTRPWIALAGQAFHTGTYLFMRISFATLQACYVSFVDWGGLLERLGWVGKDSVAWEHAATTVSKTFAIHLVGGSLLLGNMILGMAFVERAWPLACYPTFAYHQGPEVTKGELCAVSQAGESLVLDDRLLAERIYSDRCAGLIDSAIESGSPERIRALWTVMARECGISETPRAIKVYRSTYSTDPDLPESLRLVGRTEQLEFLP
jgi:hypothetical protein